MEHETNNPCGCCESTATVAPLSLNGLSGTSVAIANRPGLSALRYRVGTHGTFLKTMQARLSSVAFPALRGLTTRSTDDPAIALLDAWATVADVLTFYQERIANEGYLRTATERRSILELARLVGYALRPGVASTVYLAYLLEDKQIEPVELEVGTRAQSVPEPGEQAQSFETVEALTARCEWNELKPRLSRPQTYQSITDRRRLYIKGVAVNLKPNDVLVVEVNERGYPYRVVEVTAEPTANRTVIAIEPWAQGLTTDLGSAPFAMPRAADPEGVRDIIQFFSDIKQRGVARGPGPTRRAVDLLRILEQQLEAGLDAEQMAQFIASDTLPQLHVQLAQADAQQMTAVASWLSEMVRALAEVSGDSGPLSWSAHAFASAAAASTPPNYGPTPDQNPLRGVIDALARPGSVPPRNPLTFRRNLRAEFATHGDVGMQLIGAFQPQLRRNLERAAANAPSALPDTLKVYVLRTKASLFGHNALGSPQFESRTVGNNQQSMIVVTGYDDLNLRLAWGKGLIGDDDPVSVVALDAEYSAIKSGTWVLVQWSPEIRSRRGTQREQRVVLARTQKIRSASMQVQATSAKVTQIDLDQPWIQAADLFPDQTQQPDVLRNTIVYAQPEELPLIEEVLADEVRAADDAAPPDLGLPLDGFFSGLQAGRWMGDCGRANGREGRQRPTIKRCERDRAVDGGRSRAMARPRCEG